MINVTERKRSPVIMSKLAGKNILITGGSKGIGRAVAREMARRGANVFLVARGRDALEETQRELQRDFPNTRVGMYSADVANRDHVEQAVQAMLGEFESIDGLVNNAGLALPQYFEQAGIEDFERLIQIDYLGSVYFTKTVYPHLKPGSFITFTSSVAGFLGAFGYTSYCPAKFAQMGFAEALHQECVDKGIQVSVLCPPDTQTPGFDEENKTKPFETMEISKSAKLMNAPDVARIFVDKLLRGRFIITTNLESAVLYRLHGIAPGFSRWVMARMIRSAQRRKPSTDQ